MHASNLAVLVISVLGLNATLADSLTYSITFVGMPRDGFEARAGINSSGQIGGATFAQGHAYKGVIWNGHSYTTVVPDGGVYALNDRGQAAGLINVSRVTEAFFWSNGQLQSFGGPNSVAFGINDVGQVVGAQVSPNNQQDLLPFVWSNGKLTNIPITGYPYGVAYDINDLGEAVGLVEGPIPSTTNSFTHPFLYDPKKGLQDLGTLGGTCGGAFSVNEKGEVVGYACLPGQTPSGLGFHPFLYDSGKMTDLGTLDGLPFGIATSINSFGMVVGYDGTILPSGPQYRPFLYSGGHEYDLNTLIPSGTNWKLEVANGINDKGDIAGYGLVRGVQVAFLMTPCHPGHCTDEEPTIPTPELSSISSLASALLMVRCLYKRRALRR